MCLLFLFIKLGIYRCCTGSCFMKRGSYPPHRFLIHYCIAHFINHAVMDAEGNHKKRKGSTQQERVEPFIIFRTPDCPHSAENTSRHANEAIFRAVTPKFRAVHVFQ